MQCNIMYLTQVFLWMLSCGTWTPSPYNGSASSKSALAGHGAAVLPIGMPQTSLFQWVRK